MDRSKNVWWIISYKKFDMVRVKICVERNLSDCSVNK